MGNIKFEHVAIGGGENIVRLSGVASAIVKEHYDKILGPEQNDYMIAKFQSVPAITEQLEAGYRYYIVVSDGEDAGFMGFYPQGSEMYLSKLYLYKHKRGQGLGKAMIGFISQQCRHEGLEGIYLNVNKYNDDSIAAYKRMGFEIIRAEKNDIGHGYYMDDYVMELKL